MKRLSGIDANLLYMETPTVHMHTLKIVVLAPNPDADYSRAGVARELASRLHLLPPFGRRLVEVPFGFHHPLWIEDQEIDVDYHVREVPVPSPGGMPEMDAVVSWIAGMPLDRRRPLWEVWVLPGLAGGRVAMVGKVHHALADGVAIAQLLANVMSTTPEAAVGPAPGPTRSPEPVPRKRRLLRDALADHGRQILRLPALLRRTARNLLAVGRRRRTTAVVPPMPLRDVPMTPINGALTARRSFASTSLSLDAVKAVKTTFGVTLNDVLLALVAGSLRRYLIARGALPARPLVAEVPVATDAPADERRLAGNRLSNLFTSLCTDVPDPAQRLRAIHAVTEAAKEAHGMLGADMYAAWADFAPPRPFGWLMRLYSRLRLADRHRPAVNLIVSCVAGPRQPLHWAGGTLESIFSVGPIIEGAGFNVTAWSYVDRLNVGVLACPERVPDPHEITRGLGEALEELSAAAAREGPAARAAG
jgi:diacylglycerol O-acyltransferase / wax synthase